MRDIKRQILTDSDIRKAMLLLTLLSVVLSMACSSLAVLANSGFDLSGTLSVRKVFNDTLIISAAMPAVLCPLVVHRLLVTVRDLNIARAELDKIARTDMLTGLLNRRGFDEASQAAMAETERTGATIATMICDIDHFKRINDTFGHETGDRALRHVAGILRDVAASDPRLVVGRQGGEEFALIGKGLSVRELAHFAETIRATCAHAEFTDNGRVVPLTISIGTAIALPGDETLKQLFIRADTALYKAKGNGRNRVEASSAQALAA
ncbi:COG2199 c-di-GMP synthetase (diguanylate cyclase, GGDEF domain) [Rhabdaerophilaceae bacterium]